MNLSYELAKELKDAGFPQGDGKRYLTCHSYDTSPECREDGHIAFEPTLSELIAACGDEITLNGVKGLRYFAYPEADIDHDTRVKEFGEGSTPEEAVARLYLALNKK